MSYLARARAGFAALAAVIVATPALLAPTADAAQAAATPKRPVVVTIAPLHSLVAGVMIGTGAMAGTKSDTHATASDQAAGTASGALQPFLLIKGAGSPHSYALRPSDARALNRAAAIFRLSPDFDAFLNKILSTLPKSIKVVALAETEGLTLYDFRTGGPFEKHKHKPTEHQAGPAGHKAAAGKSQETQETHVSQENEHSGAHRVHHGDDHKRPHRGNHGQRIDGHIWLDPQNAKLIVSKAAEVLSELDPGSAQRYQANAKALLARLDALDAELSQRLSSLAQKPYVVFHDAYQYFEKRYGLSAVGSVTVNPEQTPGPKRLLELRHKIKRLGAKCIFAEPQFEPKLLKTIVEGTNVRVSTLDPLGAAIPPGPALYFTLMRNLSQSLETCLNAD